MLPSSACTVSTRDVTKGSLVERGVVVGGGGETLEASGSYLTRWWEVDSVPVCPCELQ